MDQLAVDVDEQVAVFFVEFLEHGRGGAVDRGAVSRFQGELLCILAALRIQSSDSDSPGPENEVPGFSRTQADYLRRAVLIACLAPVILARLCSMAVAAETAPADKTLVIVAPESFHAELREYVAFKGRFLPTRLVALEEVLTSHAGIDDPERLKRFLFDQWKDHKLGYVLLVGDRDILPVRYMVLDRITPNAFDYAFYPSDLYYGALAHAEGNFDDWNAEKEGFHAGYFGEVRGEKNKSEPINFDKIHYRCQVAVGRWPVSTLDELKTVAAKSEAYETSIREGRHPGARNLCLFHVGGWVDARVRLHELGARLPAGWKPEEFFFSGRGSRFSTPPPDAENILKALNQGTGLCLHAGHGTETGWEGSPARGPNGRAQMALTTKSITELKNADRLPVILSAGCSTAYFAPLGPYQAYTDVDGHEHKGTDHGEVFTAPPPPPAAYQKRPIVAGLGKSLLVQGPNGAVAYIGCNTGSQPCGLTLLDGFADALAKSHEPRIGDCWVQAISYYYDREHLATLTPQPGEWYPPSIFFQGMKFMLFGDPTLPLAPQIADSAK
jgi:hypothetical protein